VTLSVALAALLIQFFATEAFVTALDAAYRFENRAFLYCKKFFVLNAPEF